MRQQIGVALQFLVLTLLPMLIWWELQFGLPLILMPLLLVAGAVVFWIGTRLRES